MNAETTPSTDIAAELEKVARDVGTYETRTLRKWAIEQAIRAGGYTSHSELFPTAQMFIKFVEENEVPAA